MRKSTPAVQREKADGRRRRLNASGHPPSASHADQAGRDTLAGDRSSAVGKTPEQGTATSGLLATSPILEGIGGRYFADCNEAELPLEGERDLVRVAPYALDQEAAERLGAESVRLL